MDSNRLEDEYDDGDKDEEEEEEEEEEVEEEEEEDDEEEEDEENYDPDETDGPMDRIKARARPRDDTVDVQSLKEEFTQLMRERFLSGQDSLFFEYSRVDDDGQYDDLVIEDRDHEEAYFDDDD